MLQYLQEDICVGVSFIKKKHQHRCFPVNIAKFLRAPILKNIYEWLLLRLAVYTDLNPIWVGYLEVRF